LVGVVVPVVVIVGGTYFALTRLWNGNL
jgi:hypothetical protein